MSDCPSNIHSKPVEGAVHGMFWNQYNKDSRAMPVTYCKRCAQTAEGMGLFTRNDDTINPHKSQP